MEGPFPILSEELVSAGWLVTRISFLNTWNSRKSVSKPSPAGSRGRDRAQGKGRKRGDRCESWMLDTRGLIRPFCLLCILTFSRIKSLFLKKRKNYRCRCRRVSTAKITRRMKNSQAIRNSHRWTHPPNEANGESCGHFFYVFFPSSSFFLNLKYSDVRFVALRVSPPKRPAEPRPVTFCYGVCALLISVTLRARSLDRQHQHHLGTC